MPFPFTLPTTSQLSFPAHISTSTHPSLPSIATTQRTILRDVLKRHKRLPPQSQSTNLTTVLSALNDYLPYLFALDAGLSGNSIKVSNASGSSSNNNNDQTIEVVLEREVEVQWRVTLSSTIAARRATLRSLEYEIFFVMTTLAYTHTLLARNQLHLVFINNNNNNDANYNQQEQRTSSIQQASKHLLQSASIHQYLHDRSSTQWTLPSPVLDISPSIQTGLSSLARAESTLLAVLKDDPYALALSKDRDKNNNEWMIKAPEIPKVRAHLFARLCLAAAEHAGRATAMFNTAAAASNHKINEDLLSYTTSLHRTARGKACRFLGIDADLAGQLGTAIAWLDAAKIELGFPSSSSSSSTNKVNEKIAQWRIKRKLEKNNNNNDWDNNNNNKSSSSSVDAGRLEELWIVEMLDAKWNKVNDTIHAQLIPDSKALLAKLPSGREICAVPAFQMPLLDVEALRRLKGVMVDHGDGGGVEEEDDDDDSDEDEVDGLRGRRYVPGGLGGGGQGLAGREGYY